MTITDSRLKEGTVILGTAPAEMDISCQLTNVRLGSTTSADGDAVETLCGDKLAEGEQSDGFTMKGTLIQDFDAAAADSVVWYLFDNHLDEVEFSYTPNVNSPTVTGAVRVKLPDEFLGGDVNTRLTSDFEWVITRMDPRTPPAAA